MLTPNSRTKVLNTLRHVPKLQNASHRGASMHLGNRGRTLCPSARSFSAQRVLRQATPVEGHRHHILTAIPKAPSLQPAKFEGGALQAFSDASGQYVPIANIFLRDNCQCESCVHGATRQRLLDTWKIPQDIRIQSCEQDSSGFNVIWNDGHKSHYDHEWLARSAIRNSGMLRQGISETRLWDASVKAEPPIADYNAVMSSDEGLKDWLSKIREYGFSYVDGCPVDPEATEKLLERISFVRNTHYGGFYDFTSDLASKDTAYTNIALDAHTDTTYFSDPAGLQMFHLLSHTQGKGGASLLVDGFKAAAQLKQENPEAYDILSTVNIYSHASGNDGISIQPYRAFPVLLHDETNGHLVQVRWNSSDRAAIDLPVDQVDRWYDAARTFAAILSSAENEYWEQLKPGRPLVFDNWRVMHGRSAFTGKRRICGGYVNRDDYISRFKMMKWGSERVLQSLATA